MKLKRHFQFQHMRKLNLRYSLRILLVLCFMILPVQEGLWAQGNNKKDKKNKKVVICHIPPGNPDNPQSIIISENAVPAHLNHGDYIGSCGEGEPDVDNDGDGYTEEQGDCDDTDPTVHPEATEIPYNDRDDDCDPSTPDDDLDDDSFDISTDCDDTNPNVNPGAPEILDNGVDDDCDPSTPDDSLDVDQDGDEYTINEGDCDDSDPAVNPGATEIPYNSKDDDCDPSTPDDDLDGDGYQIVSDCDDTNPDIYPGAPEVPYDGIDQDCDGSDLNDMDGDGFIAEEAGGDDCDDDDHEIYPGATEIPYDGKDQDCNGSDLTDVDEDGFIATQAGGDDCDDDNPNIHPDAQELCDAVDNNCDGQIDEGLKITFYRDADNDRFGNPNESIDSCTQPLGYILDNTDCNDNDASIHPGATDLPNNNIDEDCDGEDAKLLPPDPAAVAPLLDTTVVTSFGSATEFLYTGPNPIQTGIEEGTIESYRAALLRGKVSERGGAALSGVTISILDHPEFGQTLSRTDGMFDMAVNGGGLLTVVYQKEGYLPAQRQVDTPWENAVWLPEVIMIPVDTKVTTVDLTSQEPMLVVQGNVVNDEDGTRTATILVPQGTEAEMILPNGTAQPLTTLNVRATEYTVGEEGPNSMPAPLPPQSGYTYCVELSADEALAAGANYVQFSQPVNFYVENFLNFPVGMAVPAGYYDKKQGAWIPSENGAVIKILGISGGMADVDTDGDGTADNNGLNDAEREKLATLYQADQSLWRVSISHFTPWDYNWPEGPPPDSGPPNPEGPPNPPDDDSDEEENDEECGSTIRVQSQTLGEQVGITGTSFNLHYQSDRVPERLANYTLNIPISGADLPASLERIHLEIYVAYRKITEIFDPKPNLNYTFTWDGKDAYGRNTIGAAKVKVRIGFAYPPVYYEPYEFFNVAFARFSGIPITGGIGRSEIIIWEEWSGSIGSLLNSNNGLGGWTLSNHHVYNPSTKTTYYGDGKTSNVQSQFGPVISTVAGNKLRVSDGDGGLATEAGIFRPVAIAVGDDGSFYIAEFWRSGQEGSRVRSVGPDGIINTVAGNGSINYSGDGGLATEAGLANVADIEIGKDGSLYIVDSGRVRRVGPDGIINTIAGNGNNVSSGDGGLATNAGMLAQSIAVSNDGSLYIVDGNSFSIRFVGTDGIITTIAGGNDATIVGGEGTPATETRILPGDITIGPDGSLYITDNNKVVRRIGTDGIITTVAGDRDLPTPVDPPDYDGRLATDVWLLTRNVAVDNDGKLYLSSPDSARFGTSILEVDNAGIIHIFAGDGSSTYAGDGALARATGIFGISDIDISDDGSLYYSAFNLDRVRKISSVSSLLNANEFAVPSRDGSEVYIFEISGRHLRTVHGLTGATLFTFDYDSKGQLLSATDGDNNVTRIERDANGNPTAIIAPFGQRTELTLNENGYLATVSNPAGETHEFTYHDEGGLLATFKKPRGNTSKYTYDDLGLLVKSEDPAGGFKELVRTKDNDSYEVAVTTAEGRTTTYRVENQTNGNQLRINNFPDGTKRQELIGTDGSTTITQPDGTIISRVREPDPRWGMQTPIIGSQTVTTPGGLTNIHTRNRTITLTDDNDLFSIVSRTDTVTINGRDIIITYDAFNNTFTTDTPEGRQSFITINEKGPIVKREASGITPIQFNYNGSGQLDTISQGTGTNTRSISYDYNDEGFLKNITDPFSTVNFEYDLAGRITKASILDVNEINIEHDDNGNLVSIIPPGQPAHTFSYTLVDLENEYIPPRVDTETSKTVSSYNLDRQLELVARPDGKTIAFDYEGSDGCDCGRISKITIPRGERHYDYDPSTGELSLITDSSGGGIAFEYDGTLVTGTTWTGPITGTVSVTYNNDFLVSSIDVNNVGAIVYQYDMDNLITQAGDLAINHGLQNGLITGTSIGNMSDTFGYNELGELISYHAEYNGIEMFDILYTRDLSGRITQKTVTIDGNTNTYNYLYNLAGRLKEVQKDGNAVANYTYDDNGNRLTYTNGGITVNGTYDDQDRLLQYGATTYTYTQDGELLSKDSGGQTTTYDYDVLGNLMSVSLQDGREIEYIIDGMNRRIGKKINDALVQGFLYSDELNPIAELDGNNNIVSRFHYSSKSNVPDYIEKDDNTYRIISDHLGSVRLVVDVSNGNIAQRLDYDGFGNIILDTNPGFQPFGFGGGIYDIDTGFIRFGARDYDAEIGRWTIKDPIGFAGRDENFYAYVKNDPINHRDSNGMDSWKRIKKWYDKYKEWKKWEEISEEIDKLIDKLNDPDKSLPEQGADVVDTCLNLCDILIPPPFNYPCDVSRAILKKGQEVVKDWNDNQREGKKQCEDFPNLPECQ